MTWNYNFDEAPRGNMIDTTIQTKKGPVTRHVFKQDKILFTMHDGNVQIGWWIPKAKNGGGDRWVWFNQGTNPRAWMHMPEPAREMAT